MAETNGLSWNFNPIEYAKPTELRGGYGQDASALNSSLFGTTGAVAGANNFSSLGNWSSIGMNGLFSGVASLCSFADSFTQQNAGIIAQAEAYNDQMFSQSLYQAQQTAALRDQLRAQGINPDSVLNGNGIATATATNSTSNQLSQLLALLGLGGTTGQTSTPTYSYNDEDGGDDAFWEYIDSKVNQSKQQNSLQALLAQLIV